MMYCGNTLGRFYFVLVRQIDALKLMTKAELVNWFMEHRGDGSRMLSVHVSSPAVCLLDIGM